MKANFTINLSQRFKSLEKIAYAALLGFSVMASGQVNQPSKTEDISKRTQFSKHFINSNGSYTAMVTAGSSLNYLSTEGKWENIDLTISSNTTGKNQQHAWANTANQFHTFYPSNASGEIITEYKEGIVKEGFSKKMVWMDEYFNVISSVPCNASSAAVSNNKIAYSNIFPNVDLIYSQQNDGRKMDYVLNNSSIVNSAPMNAKYLAFAENFEMPSEAKILSLKNESGNIINFNVMLGDNIVFRYELPKHKDNGNKVIESFYVVNQNTIYTMVEKSWLNSGLAFPVTIDPTTTVYPTASGDYNTGCIDNQANKNAAADINVGMREAYGAQAGTPRRFFRSWASFDVTSIPDDASISNVTFGCHLLVNSLYNPEGQNVRVAPITSGVPNQMIGGTLYNAINENSANGIFTINPLPTGVTTPLDATLDITTLATTSVTSSLAGNMYSLGFVPIGNYDSGFSEFISVYGSSHASQTTGGKPYLTVTYTTTMGIGDRTKSVGIYPNPVQSELFIKSDINVRSIEVFSMLGQRVASQSAQSSIAVSGLSNGIYSVQITLEDGAVVNQKFIKN